MNRMISIVAAWGLAALMVLCVPQMANALGLRVKAGVSLTNEPQIDTFRGMGGEFNSFRWMIGGNLDLGSVMLPKLYLVPGADFAIKKESYVDRGTNGEAITVKEDLRVYTVSLDGNYFFHDSLRGRGYAGIGPGIHFFRLKIDREAGIAGQVPVSDLQNNTKISLNFLLGYQRKLGPMLAWFGEMKAVIADDQQDSALQFTIGFHFGNE